MPKKLRSRSADVYAFDTLTLVVTTLESVGTVLAVARFDVGSSFAPGGLASPPVTLGNVATAEAVFILLSVTFSAAALSVVRRPSFVALRGDATVALKEANRGGKGRKSRRIACLFGVSATTLVVPLGGGGVGGQQPASTLLSLLTEKASEPKPLSPRLG